MGTNQGQQSADVRARRRVELTFRLAVYCSVYVAVNAGLVIAAVGLAGSWWRQAGWGLGVAVYTVHVLGDGGRRPRQLAQHELAGERSR